MNGQVSHRIPGVGKPLDAVAPADVCTELQKLIVGGVADVPVAADFIVGNLDGNRLMVVFRTAGGPGAVAFLYVQHNLAVCPNAIVGGSLPIHVAEGVCQAHRVQIFRHVVDRNLPDGSLPREIGIGGEVGILGKGTVAGDNRRHFFHSQFPPYIVRKFRNGGEAQEQHAQRKRTESGEQKPHA